MIPNSSDLIMLPRGSIRILDPEEEIFLLYTRLSGKGSADGTKRFSGLGSVDSKEDTLVVKFELPPPVRRSPEEKSKKRRAKASSSRCGADAQMLEIELKQDKTSLRSKRGDTGSVLWRVSVELGQFLINGLRASSVQPLLDPERLKECNVLELGAGTGLLSIALAPFVRHYTATDLDYLVPLIRKNIALNVSSVQQQLFPRTSSSPRHKSEIGHRVAEAETRIVVEALDWTELRTAAPHRRNSLFRLEHADPPDLIVVADCIFNPALVPALVEVINHYARTGHTRVLVAVELRAEDVLREFLEMWLSSGAWEIWRVDNEEAASELTIGTGTVPSRGWLGEEFAVWIGWKTASDSEECS